MTVVEDVDGELVDISGMLRVALGLLEMPAGGRSLRGRRIARMAGTELGYAARARGLHDLEDSADQIFRRVNDLDGAVSAVVAAVRAAAQAADRAAHAR